MFIPWWLIILGILVISAITGAGNNALRRRVEELEEKVLELENEREDMVSSGTFDDLYIDGDN